MNAMPASVLLYTAEQTRALDRVAMESFAIPGYTLMGRAGAALLRVALERWPRAERWALVCGTGNNGGDGYVAARLAREAGLKVSVWQLGDPATVRGEAAQALADLRAAGIEPTTFDPAGLARADLVVDALLGTGLARPVEGAWAQAIAAINASGLPVLAVDIPSGLSADRGVALGTAVRAAVTVSFIGRNRGLYTGEALDHVGEVVFAGLGVPAAVYARVSAAARLLERTPGEALGRRSRNAHKGAFGHVLVVGGNEGLGGAARLAAEAAARTGAGLVSLAVAPVHGAGLIAGRPELMARGVGSPTELDPLLERASVVALGPGLGQGPWGEALWEAVLASERPLVMDADALNLLARQPACRQDWILTPHPGEAARLLGSSAAEVQADRFAAVAELQRRYGGVAVLKGAGTLVQADEAPVGVCAAGNPGMASGGMGDVLTGVIAGLLAQGASIREAAELGVWTHGRAADRAAAAGERGLLAGDVIAALRPLVNGLAG